MNKHIYENIVVRFTTDFFCSKSGLFDWFSSKIDFVHMEDFGLYFIEAIRTKVSTFGESEMS